MKILALEAENFKKLRVVEIRPNGRMVEITGRNGQGKTSVLDALWFGLKGKKALPLKPVRKGAERMKVKLDLGEFTVTRTMGNDSDAPTLHIEMRKGTRDKTPERFLDDILGELTFDPLAFIHMEPKEQVAVLRQTAKVDLDFEAIAEANQADYDARKLINREISTIEAQLAGVTVLDGLPKEKIDEEAIVARLNAAGDENRKAREIFQAKQNLGAKAANIGFEQQRAEQAVVVEQRNIADLQRRLAEAKKELQTKSQRLEELRKEHAIAEQAFQSAPAGEPIDVAALTAELQSAQRTNRAIEARASYDEQREKLEAKKRQSVEYTRSIEQREESKRAALAEAKIPVDGLVFDETQVLYKGLPLENLGEGEQIRISTKIGMAMNPKLRVLCIRHGEALDEDGMNVLAELAEEHDFQIWMARVDSSGKVGIVMEDGMVAASKDDE